MFTRKYLNTLLIFTHGSEASVYVMPENLMFSHLVSLLKRVCDSNILPECASIGHYAVCDTLCSV